MSRKTPRPEVIEKIGNTIQEFKNRGITINPEELDTIMESHGLKKDDWFRSGFERQAGLRKNSSPAKASSVAKFADELKKNPKMMDQTTRVDRIADIPKIPKRDPNLEKYEIEQIKKAREALISYKKDAKILRDMDEAELSRPPTVKDSKYPSFSKEGANPYFREHQAGFRSGVDAVGKKKGDMFVKQAKRDSDLAGPLRREVKKHSDKKFSINSEKARIRDNTRMKDRAVMQNLLGTGKRQVGTPTYVYEGPTGKVSLMQQAMDTKTIEKMDEGAFKVIQQDVIDKAKDKPVKLTDIHSHNVGLDPRGNPKVIDVGHSYVDIDYARKNPSLMGDMMQRFRINSPYNKARLLEAAKTTAKRLPMLAGKILKPLGWGAAAAGIAAAPNKAMAATDFLLDEGSMGILQADDLGGDLPPHILANQRAYNAKMRLEQAKRAKQLRQQRKNYGNDDSPLY